MIGKNGWKSILIVIKWMLIFLVLYNGYWMLLGKLILATEQEVAMSKFISGLITGAIVWTIALVMLSEVFDEDF